MDEWFCRSRPPGRGPVDWGAAAALPRFGAQRFRGRYVRFGSCDPGVPARGVFALAGDVLDRTSESETEEIEALLAWFKQNLRVMRLPHRRALFFFKPHARVHIQKAWELAWALRAHGEMVHLATAARVGTIIAEDEHQIAAIP
jgi:hypothetical protein